MLAILGPDVLNFKKVEIENNYRLLVVGIIFRKKNVHITVDRLLWNKLSPKIIKTTFKKLISHSQNEVILLTNHEIASLPLTILFFSHILDFQI